MLGFGLNTNSLSQNPLLQHSNTPALHHSITPSLRFSSLHYSNTPVLHENAMEAPDTLKAHALSWIDAWNRHDVEGILSRYTDDVMFQAATVVRRWNKPDGILLGKAELRAHFAKGLELDPDLNFQFEEIFRCPGGYAVLSMATA